VFRDSITRVSYAYNDSKTPFLIALSSIALKAILNYVLILRLNMGIAGITLSTSLVTLFNATMLGLFMCKKIKLDYPSLFKNLAKMLAAGVITYFSCVYLSELFNNIALPKYYYEATKIISVSLACGILYVVINLVLKVDYVNELFTRLKKRFVK
jgi:putative peptidoglycan lipid II flippase